jgi:hypothetical protein
MSLHLTQVRLSYGGDEVLTDVSAIQRPRPGRAGGAQRRGEDHPAARHDREARAQDRSAAATWLTLGCYVAERCGGEAAAPEK